MCINVTLRVIIIWIAFVWEGGHPSDVIRGKSQHSRKWNKWANPAKNEIQWTILDGTRCSSPIWSKTLNIGCKIWRPETRSTMTNPPAEERYFWSPSTLPNPFPFLIIRISYCEKTSNENWIELAFLDTFGNDDFVSCSLTFP